MKIGRALNYIEAYNPSVVRIRAVNMIVNKHNLYAYAAEFDEFARQLEPHGLDIYVVLRNDMAHVRKTGTYIDIVKVSLETLEDNPIAQVVEGIVNKLKS